MSGFAVERLGVGDYPERFFRTATLADAMPTYEWRLAAEGQDVYEGRATKLEGHISWLLSRIRNPLVKLLIWEEGGKSVGMVRIDSNGELAFHADDDEAAVRMLRTAQAFADEYGGRLKATVDATDPKWELLVRAGYGEYPARSVVYKAVDKSVGKSEEKNR